MNGATPDTPERFDAVIVGGGPRGVATVLRIAARVATAGRPPVRLALVDAVEVGAGGTWSTAQSAAYLNNTQASATTIHPDASTPMTGPPAPGPDLVDWARGVTAAGTHPAGDWVVREAAELRPDSFPTRRLQGVYFRDQLQDAVRGGHVEVEAIRDLALDLGLEDRDDGTADTAVRLAAGRVLAAPTVVLAQGMVQARPDAEVRALEAAAERHGLRYVRPGMPAERGFTALEPGETVLVRGLGATFFDVIGQLAEHWGGELEPVPGDPHGRLRYRPSGREAQLVAGSRRGLPYRSKPDGGRPVRPFTARWATPEWFAGLRERGGVDVRAEVWPRIAAEFARCHLEALATTAPEALSAAAGPGGASARDRLDAVVAAGGPAAEVDHVLAEAVADPAWTWQVAELFEAPAGPEGWERRVRRELDLELGSLAEPATHPRAAVNGAMGSLRREVARLGAAGAVTGESFARDVLGWFDAIGLALASGPPADRTRVVLALVEAGVLELLGPRTAISVDEERGRFVASSPVSGRSAAASVLLETRMSKGKVPATDDPLLRSLLDSGRARVHAVDGVPTASVEATPAAQDEDGGGHNLVAADGTVDPAVVVLGIPALSTQPGSAIGASPGVPSPLLAGADVAARQVLARARHHRPAGLSA